MYSVVFVRLAVRSSILRENNFNVRYYQQVFQTLSFIPAMLRGTIDTYNCMSFSVTLTLVWDRLVGLVVKAPASRADDPGFHPA